MDVVAIGDNTSDWYLTLGQVFPGGNAVNVAVAVARSGGSSGYVGAVGDDARGRLLMDSLAAERVDTRRLSVTSGSTAWCQVTHVNGERRFRPGQRGAALFRPTGDDLAFAATASIIHSTYCSGLEDVLPELARRSRVSFDFSNRLADGYADDLLPFVHVAEFSAAALDDRDCAELVRWAASRGPAVVLVTRGCKGAMLFDGAVSVSVTAAPSEIVDSLGAGDSFIGRALYGLICGEPAEALLEASSRAAARTCSTWGAFGHGVDVPACCGGPGAAGVDGPARMEGPAGCE
ncbi:MAG TPA: PfkB family carbohydrate kinase [Streptosporangiaceae bacterium]|nr:PfkB family carbohydrate kinase [Streptosporangiaceae bacterium]